LGDDPAEKKRGEFGSKIQPTKTGAQEGALGVVKRTKKKLGGKNRSFSIQKQSHNGDPRGGGGVLTGGKGVRMLNFPCGVSNPGKEKDVAPRAQPGSWE